MDRSQWIHRQIALLFEQQVERCPPPIIMAKDDPYTYEFDSLSARIRQEFMISSAVMRRNAHAFVSGATDGGGPVADPPWIEQRVHELLALACLRHCEFDTDGDGHCGRRGCPACGGPPP